MSQHHLGRVSPLPDGKWGSLESCTSIYINNCYNQIIMLRLIVVLTTLILTFYLPEQMHIYWPLVEAYFANVLRLEKDRGLAFTVKYVKATRLAVTRFITGHPLSAIDGVELKEGWPVWLAAFLLLIPDTTVLKLLMTLFVSLGSVRFPVVLDITPIISPWSGSNSLLKRNLTMRLDNWRPDQWKWSFNRCHMSTKLGPLDKLFWRQCQNLRPYLRSFNPPQV